MACRDQCGLRPRLEADLERGADDGVNAIGEQAPEKKTFRDALLRRRCLVPATAFYEWKPKGDVGMPLPYAFGRADREPFAIAGLWEREPGEEEGRRR